MGEVIMFPGTRSVRCSETAQPAPPEQTQDAEAPPHPTSAPRPSGRAMLWREAAGHELRKERRRQGRTQSDVAESAGVSTQYLSEIERGRKEPSSEILAAVLTALGLGLLDLTAGVHHSLSTSSTQVPGPGGVTSQVAAPWSGLLLAA